MKLKICLVTGQYPPQMGGVGHSAFRVANMLADRGMDVHVVHFVKHKAPIPFDEAVESAQKENVLVHRVKVYNQPLSEGVSEHEMLTRYNREMFDALHHFQRKNQYDVLHAFFLYPAAYITGLVGKMLGVKVIASVRGNDIGKYAFDPIRMPLIKSALENADYVTSVATSLIELADKGLTPIAHKSRTILNSIDFSRLTPKNKPDLKLKGLVIGSIGLFRYKKGMVYLCKALGRLKDKFDFTLLLVGDYFKEEDREPHVQFFKENGLEDRVIVTGRIPHGEVSSYIDLLDILVFPSLFSEGCPLSMLEAMAMKKVIIGSRAGAIPEILCDGENGLLINPGSSEEVEQALLKLANDPGLRLRLSEKAAETVQGRTLRKEFEDWMSVYEEVVRS